MRLIDADEYEKRIKPYDTEDVMDKALYNFAHEKLITTSTAQPERLTDDDFETIRIHLSACKEKLCKQHRWKEAEEYQRIIDRFMAFASAQPDVTEEAVKEYCRKRCLTILTNDYFHKLSSAEPKVIRCKDCIYYRQEIDMCDEPCSTAHNIVHEDDYCSRAKGGTDEARVNDRSQSEYN